MVVSFHGYRRNTGDDEEESEAPVSKLVYATLAGMHAPFKFAPWNQGRMVSFKNHMVPWLQEKTLPEEFFKDIPLPIVNGPISSSNGASVMVSGGKSSKRKQLTTL
jgi:hypothetical protein